MGHVDHGKTTLLDRIRKTNVAGGEEGGITQHIGAYQVEVEGRKITFIDTPGHEAFTALRAVPTSPTSSCWSSPPTTASCPRPSKRSPTPSAAGVRMVVAINKMDVSGADPMRSAELAEHEVITEELGGDIPSVEVSALPAKASRICSRS